VIGRERGRRVQEGKNGTDFTKKLMKNPFSRSGVERVGLWGGGLWGWGGVGVLWGGGRGFRQEHEKRPQKRGEKVIIVWRRGLELRNERRKGKR